MFKYYYEVRKITCGVAGGVNRSKPLSITFVPGSRHVNALKFIKISHKLRPAALTQFYKDGHQANRQIDGQPNASIQKIIGNRPI